MRRPRRVSRHLARQPFGTLRAARCPSPGHDGDRSPSRTTRRATTWFPPRRVLPGRRGLSAPRRPPWPSVVRFPPARYREHGVRCLCDASTAYAAASQRGTRSALGAAITRRALRPGNVACGDRCVRGTLAPRHHAGTNNLVSTTLGATGLKADLAPRHYRIPPPGDRPRKMPSAASGRRSGSDGPCASDRLLDEHYHGADHRLVGAGPLHVGPAGIRRPQDAPTALDSQPPRQRRAAGTVRTHRHDAAVGRRLVGWKAPAGRPSPGSTLGKEISRAHMLTPPDIAWAFVGMLRQADIQPEPGHITAELGHEDGRKRDTLASTLLADSIIRPSVGLPAEYRGPSARQGVMTRRGANTQHTQGPLVCW